MSDSKKLLKFLYNEYCKKINSGSDKAKSKLFGSSKEIQENIFPEWSPEKVDKLCKKLDNQGLLDVFYADNIAYKVQISEIGLKYAKNNF